MLQDGPDRFQEDLDVQADGPVVDVFRVQPDDFLEVRDRAPAGDLPHAGDAGLGGQAGAVVVFVFLPLVLRRGTGAHQGHVSPEDVEELGELIQAGAADEFADAGLLLPVHNPVPDDARIPVELEHHAVGVAVLGLEFLFAVLGVHVHGAEFVDRETLAVLADAGLPEEDRAGALLFDHQADDGDQEKGDKAADQAAEEVNEALEDQLDRAGAVGRHGQDVVAGDFLHKALAADAGDREADMDRNGHLAALFNQAGHPGLPGAFLRFPGFPAGGAGAVGVFDEILHGLVVCHFQVRQVLRVDEDLVHPFPADVVRRGVDAGDDLFAADRLARGVPVAEHDARVFKAVQVAGPLQDPGNRLLLRHQDHGALGLVPVDPANERLPEHADQVAEDQVETGGQVQGDTGIRVAGLGGEQVQGHDQQDQHHVLDRRGQFLQVAALHDVVQGVEQHGDQDVHDHQDDCEGPVVRLQVGPFPPVVADHITQDKGRLENKDIPEHEIKVLEPALGVPFIHIARSLPLSKCGWGYPMALTKNTE